MSSEALREAPCEELREAPREALRIGLIGCGAIGGEIARIAAASEGEALVVGALVRTARDAGQPPCVTTLAALLALHPAIVIECAGQAALRAHGAAVLEAGIRLVPASVGLLADAAAFEQLRRAARKGGSAIVISNGAIAGIDALAGARHVGLEAVRLRSVMPFGPDDAPGSEGGKTIYRGSAREAALRYPRHANLAATVALLGLGFERTEVELVADAGVQANRHEIHASGAFGTFSVVVEGRRIRAGSPSSRLVAGSLYSACVRGGPAV